MLLLLLQRQTLESTAAAAAAYLLLLLLPLSCFGSFHYSCMWHAVAAGGLRWLVNRRMRLQMLSSLLPLLEHRYCYY